MAFSDGGEYSGPRMHLEWTVRTYPHRQAAA